MWIVGKTRKPDSACIRVNFPRRCAHAARSSGANPRRFLASCRRRIRYISISIGG
jgi:hypothetical protein